MTSSSSTFSSASSTFSARGLPHIHSCAWIDEEWFEKVGLDRVLQRNTAPEKKAKIVEEIIDKYVSCSIPEDNEHLKELVTSVQKHKIHKKTCYKNGKNGRCRFGFPRLPSQETVIADSTLLAGLPEEEQDSLIKEYQDILNEAREILEDKDIDEDMSYESFIDLLCSKMKKYKDYSEMNQAYKNALRTTKHGSIIILKRKVKERFINNYSAEWLTAWEGNLDIQVAFDIYAIITYIVSYIGKDETGLVSMLLKALHESGATAFHDQVQVLKSCFLNMRQCGVSEAIYRTLPSLHLKDSNITVNNIALGFPENRGVFYFKVKDTEPEEDDLESQLIGEQSNQETTIRIPGRNGSYRQSVAIWDKYANRPKILEKMCLFQFAAFYDFSKTIPTKSRIEQGHSVDEISEGKHIHGTDIKLPKYIKLENTAGYMKLRTNPSVLRFHAPSKKEPLEQMYAEIFAYSAWRNEANDIPRGQNSCKAKYNSVKDEMKANRQAMFPLEDDFDVLEVDLEDPDNRPQHIYDQLDPQGEQENQEDQAIGTEEDTEFNARHTDFAHEEESAVHYDNFQYPPIDPISKNDLLELVRSLHPEQYKPFEKLVQYCKKVKRARKPNSKIVQALRMIIHGGAGSFL